MNMILKEDYVKYDDGGYVSVRQVMSSIKSDSPSVFYMHGTCSSIDSTKALFMRDSCQKNGVGLTQFNFRGHGNSSGKFVDFTISDWLQDAIKVMDEKTEGPQILVGSSMGGWIMFLLALARPNRVAGLIGISAAPDFTQVIWDALPDKLKEELYKNGAIYTPTEGEKSVYPWTLKLLEDGQKNLVLDKKLDISCPVHLLQGDSDTVVPWQTAFKIKDALQGDKVKITLFKNGLHNLSSEFQLQALQNAVLEQVKVH